MDSMRRAGFTDHDLGLVMGGNWLRLFDEIFDRPSA
jgi:microsomal dipeptidase-like Zn-dependent dipeptidase